MNEEHYYTAPSDEIFEECKQAALELWREICPEFYETKDKYIIISRLENCRDNFMYICAGFDMQNQLKHADKLSKECLKEISSRYMAGGGEARYDVYGPIYASIKTFQEWVNNV